MATLIGAGSHARDIMATLDMRIWKVVAHHDQFDPYAEAYIIGINDPWTRHEIASKYLHVDESWRHPATVVGPDCEWGDGTHINYGVTMTRTTLGHHVTVSPGVTICGDVTIGDRVLIGAGATICDRVTIGNDVTIGAGAVVLPESVVPDGETWYGVPAKRAQ